MRKLSSAALLSIAAVIAAAASTVTAKEQTRATFSESRIHPDSILYQPVRSDGSVAPPPPINITAAPPAPAAIRVEREKEPEVLPYPLSTSEMVEAVKLCVEVVKPDFELDLRLLFDNSWGYTRPAKTQNALGQFEKVDYIKGDITISLQDFGDKILCRAIGLIADKEQFAEIRNKLTSSLGAAAISEAPGYELAAKFVAERQTKSSIDNVYILGEHVIEIATIKHDLSNSGIVGAGVETMVLLTASPTAANFRQLNKALENQ